MERLRLTISLNNMCRSKIIILIWIYIFKSSATNVIAWIHAIDVFDIEYFHLCYAYPQFYRTMSWYTIRGDSQIFGKNWNSNWVIIDMLKIFEVKTLRIIFPIFTYYFKFSTFLVILPHYSCLSLSWMLLLGVDAQIHEIKEKKREGGKFRYVGQNITITFD